MANFQRSHLLWWRSINSMWLIPATCVWYVTVTLNSGRSMKVQAHYSRKDNICSLVDHFLQSCCYFRGRTEGNIGFCKYEIKKNSWKSLCWEPSIPYHIHFPYRIQENEKHMEWLVELIFVLYSILVLDLFSESNILSAFWWMHVGLKTSQHVGPSKTRILFVFLGFCVSWSVQYDSLRNSKF